MITLILQAIKEWVEEIIASLGLITTYNTMPNDSVLLAMPNGTTFSTRGYYSPLDGAGGTYKISDTYYSHSRRITNDTITRYLIALDEDGGANNFVNLTRYGIRDYLGTRESFTDESSFANSNSDIIENIISGDYFSTWYLPSGRYYFKRGISLSSNGICLKGECQPNTNVNQFSDSGAKVKGGTCLVFPFLNNGDSAITSGNGNVEDIAIIGDPSYYSIEFNRNAITTDPTQVVTETIKQVSGSDVKCIGLNKTAAGWVKNVFICNFYTGMNGSVTSFYASNIFTSDCHDGAKLNSDAKVRGIYGWRVRNLVTFDGLSAQSSVEQLRADSCEHVVYMVGTASDISLNGVDGDFCTGSLIEIGDGTTYTKVDRCKFVDIKGRYDVLKAYISGTDAKPSARNLNTSNSEGWGAIHVNRMSVFCNNYVIASSTDRSVLDSGGDSRYKMPEIIFTFNNDSANSINNTFMVLNDYIENGEASIRNLFQIGNNIEFRVDNALGTYYVKGQTIKDFDARISALENA